jgi:phosphatidylserine synthase
MRSNWLMTAFFCGVLAVLAAYDGDGWEAIAWLVAATGWAVADLEMGLRK